VYKIENINFDKYKYKYKYLGMGEINSKIETEILNDYSDQYVNSKDYIKIINVYDSKEITFNHAQLMSKETQVIEQLINRNINISQISKSQQYDLFKIRNETINTAVKEVINNNTKINIEYKVNSENTTIKYELSENERLMEYLTYDRLIIINHYNLINRCNTELINSIPGGSTVLDF
jgi:hypothetical protein